MSKVGVVIPTIFDRPNYLADSVLSARKAGDVHILLVAPDNPEMTAAYSQLVDECRREKVHGHLSAKINQAIRQLPEDCEFITWLGDDDLLTPDSLRRAVSTLSQNPKVAVVFGSCDYIDAQGQKIGGNPSGNWAKHLMFYGPFLIPQPGSVWRRSAFESIGGLDESFQLAFDHDMFLRLSKYSGAMFINKTQAEFRWHAGSLSVNRRWQSVIEASRARRKHYKSFILPLILIWEPVVIIATKLAGDFVSWRTLKN